MGDWIDNFQEDTAEILAFNKSGNIYIVVMYVWSTQCEYKQYMI